MNRQSLNALMRLMGPTQQKLACAACAAIVANNLPPTNTLIFAAAALVSLSLLFWLVVLYLIASADCDLALRLRGKHKKGAFKDKVVWITGASQGLGELMSLYLAAQGARLILSARGREKLEAVRDACVAKGAADVLVLPLDLTGSYEQLEAAAAAADEAFGGAGVDYLIQNAGASQHGLAVETSAEVSKALIDLNALGPIALTRAAVPKLIARGHGRIVYIASMAALVPAPGQATYSAAKMAVRGYAHALATEIAGTGVSVTVCCPGPTSTGGPGDTPRHVYGTTGKVTRAGDTKGKMTPDRAVQLIMNAAAAGVDEAWMAKQPVLLMAYLMQYIPQLGMMVLKRVGPSRAKAISTGESGYDFQKLVKAGTSGNSSRQSSSKAATKKQA